MDHLGVFSFEWLKTWQWSYFLRFALFLYCVKQLFASKYMAFSEKALFT